jgi:FkbM family methyltransferase
MAGDVLARPIEPRVVPRGALRAMKSLATAGKLLRARRTFSRPAKSQPPRAVYVGKNRLLVGTTIGGQDYAFYVEADDRLLSPWFALTGVHEADVTAFLLKTLRPDAHCIDVGANFGYFACLMARACRNGRVLAVEPDAELAGLVQDNFCLNGVHERASIVRGAIADCARELTLYRREFRSGNTSMIAVDQSFTDYFNEPSRSPSVSRRKASTCWRIGCPDAWTS